MPIGVAIVEDDEGIRESLAILINGSAGFRCVKTYAEAESALDGLPALRPDVVLMDIHLPKMSGIDCVRRLRVVLPKLPVIMLTVYDDADRLFESLVAGARGYLLKRTPPSKLLDAIDDVYRGGAPMSRQIARKVVQYFHQSGSRPTAPAPVSSNRATADLTDRELEILGCLTQGLRYKEIADRLAISADTVRGHLRNIYEKLHVHSRTEAVVKFLGKS
jgi:DNA-binding NarL/FixJ family response regulator